MISARHATRSEVVATLRMEQARIAYGRRVLIDRLNFEIRAGEAFVLFGPNGSGKTSLLRLAAGIARPVTGQVRSNFRMIGYVPQVQHVDRQFPVSVRDLLRMSFVGVRYLTRSGLRKERERKIEDALDVVGLGGRGHLLLRSCSGGELQRAMIGRALALGPDLLILDEPTAGVDIELRRSMWEFLRELNANGTTIILTTHYLEEAESLCRNIAIIDHGSIIQNTTKHNLLNMLDTETFVFDLSAPRETAPELPGFSVRLVDELCMEVEIKRGQDINELFEQFKHANVAVKSMRSKANRLEELFVRLVESSVV